MNEFNLSEKIINVERYGAELNREAIPPEDVKEFIKLLKEMNCKVASKREYFMLWSTLNQEIDKLAGSKLT